MPPIPLIRSRLNWLRQLHRQSIKLSLQLDSSVISMILVIKGALLIFGTLSYLVLMGQQLEGAWGWLKIWNHWNAPHYLDIARYGYKENSNGLRLLAFYPLFPWLTRLLELIDGNYLVSAFVLSGLASVVAGVLLKRLAQLDHPAALAQGAVWFLFIFPTSYFLHIGYTESLFLALTLSCFLAARKQHWRLAGIFGALACLTRINGLVLVPALIVEALHQYWLTRGYQRSWLWIGVIPLGFSVYLLVNFYVTGSPFTFLTVEHDYWYKSLRWPWVGIWTTIKSCSWRSPEEAQMVCLQELIFITLDLVCTLWCWMCLRPAYGMWMTGNWLLFTSSSFILSVPRYTLILFPIYILFAKVAVNRFCYIVITVWSLLFLAFFSSLFVQGRWAF